MGTHRPAEFSRDHVPSFMRGTDARDWLCVYPFVRSYEWYLLPEDERREMLREHGLAGRAFPKVQANTVAAFALNDYEWILALEADDLHDLVDLMRDLRSTAARRHVREEIPFYTGRRIEAAGVVEILR
jgi:chlorite dismutase